MPEEVTRSLDFNGAASQGSAWGRAQFDLDAVRTEVARRAQQFVEWLLPGAVVHRSGRYAVVGDVLGAPGESLHIDLTGPKAGHWHDFACPNDSGTDLIGLYMASLGYDRTRDFSRALTEIATEFLGRVPAPICARPVTEQLEARARRHEQKPRPTINDRPPPTETYVYKAYDEAVIGVVRRHEYDDLDPARGKPRKTFSVWDARTGKAQAPDPRPLYRVPNIMRAEHVVFVEGERKADALAARGLEATCIMFGSNAPLDKVDWQPIAGKIVTLWPDHDASGLAFARKLIPLLQSLGCRVSHVQIPSKAPNTWDAFDCIAEGKDPHEFVNAAVPVAASSSSRVRIYDIDDLEHLPAPSWLIDGVVTEGGLCVIWGRPGVMKSFVALDIGLCVATGAPWHGKGTKAGLVLYIAAEGSWGLSRRAIGWRRTKGKELGKPRFKLIPHTIALTGHDLAPLLSAILQLEEIPVLIIVDTLARTFGAGDENKQADMNAYVAAADRIREATGANVMIIHHSGVHEDKRERGSNVLRGAADTVINVTRRGETQIELINKPPMGKQKDHEEFETIKLRAQRTNYEQNGTELLTITLMPDDNPFPSDTADDQGQKFGKVEQQVLTALTGPPEPLGLTRLAAITGAHKKSLTRALDRLTEKGLVQRVDDGNSGRKLWSLL